MSAVKTEEYVEKEVVKAEMPTSKIEHMTSQKQAPVEEKKSLPKLKGKQKVQEKIPVIELSKDSAELGSDIDEPKNNEILIPTLNVLNSSYDVRMSVKSLNMSQISVVKEYIYDDKGHLLDFRFQFGSSLVPTDKCNFLECSYCNDDIDQVVGYYSCKICAIDLCRECTFDRRKNEMDLAEDPTLMPTPHYDLEESQTV